MIIFKKNKCLMKQVAALLLMSYACWTWAEGFIVRDIRIEGLQRISASRIFEVLPVAVGDILDQEKSSEIISKIFQTGYFQDIQVGQDGAVLVITVVERPAISSIEIEGEKAISKEDLLEGMKQSGLAVGNVFERAVLERVQQELQRQYIAQGRYGAKVDVEVLPQPRNRVAVKVKITEGEVAAIQQINIVGNTVFEDKKLLKQFELGSSNFLSFFTNNDKYSREKLSGDLETLRSYYLDRGYINFAIESTQVSITPDKQHVYVTVNISEGDKYTVGEVRLAGKLIVPETELRKLLIIQKGQTFSRQLLTLTGEALSKRLGNEGYTFTNVNPIPDINDEKDIVDITFFVDPGKRTYVHRINFAGNTKTIDEVLRREMRQMESSWASTDKIELSKTRLDRLGFFKEVNVETPLVPGTDDQIDVDFAVEEQPSGAITASLGFSQGAGIILGASVSQDNFMGTGDKVSFAVNNSDFQTLYSFDYLQPYYTIDGVSRGFNFIFKETDFEEGNISDYTTDTLGTGINFGYPLNDNTRLSFGADITQTDIKEGEDPAVEITDYLNEEGDSFTDLILSGGLNWSTLNRGIFPDRGASYGLSVELTPPGSDLQYYKTTYKAQYFHPLGETFTVRFRGKLGSGAAYGGTSSMPFYNHFFAGGFGSVRGYEDNTLGPRTTPSDDAEDPDPFGGNMVLEGASELIFPPPFIEDTRSVRTAFFVDTGNVYDTERGDSVSLGELRYSTGFALSWLTPIGPLSFSLAKPLNTESGDDEQIFQFALGKPF